MAEKRKSTKTKQVKVKKGSALPPSSDSKGLWKFLVPVLVITFIIFIPALKNGFTNWDDTMYVTENPLLKDLSIDGLKAIFSTPVVSNYHPITVLSLALNYQFAELNPWSYHLTSILLHLMNTALVFWFIMLLSGKQKWVSTIATLLWAIHPMHVESVAWISERKDLLYTLFYVLGMIIYIRYLQKKELKYLIIVTLLGALSLLCKPAAIVLPLSLMLLDYFFKRPWAWSWVIEKIPLFIMSGIMAYVTVNIQSEKAIASVELYGFMERICFAGFGLIWYLIKFIFPYPLSALHPFPDPLPVIYYIATLASIAGIIFLIYKVKSRNYQFGFGFYIINLLLVLQLISIGNAVVAERYTYVPYISLFFLLCIEINSLLKNKSAQIKNFVLGIGCIWILALCFLTIKRIPVWRTSETLWENVLNHYPDSPRAWTNKGLLYFDTKEWTKVIDHLSNALKYDPQYANALEWRGRSYLEMNEGEKALPDAIKFHELYPDKIDALFLLARSYEATGHAQEAVNFYDQLIAKAPDVPEYYNNRGTIYFNQLKKYEEAAKDFERCIQLKPDTGLYYLNLSRCYYMLGNIDQARVNAQKAKELGEAIDPAYAGAVGLQ
ncbi:MAG TPA: tetratricopeptide repeat protein [Saprospiraceae bacterium]|nr:tetratricopeptide repeat protein [Saprospiraceae bacterium]